MDPFLASIWLFGGNFAMRNFAECAGQLLPISQNTALFSLIGTNFGGNGSSTFGLPDLRGRTPIGAGDGPGLSVYDLGEQTGTDQITLLATNIPAHNHQVAVYNQYNATNSTTTPAGCLFSEGKKQGSLPTDKALAFYNTSTPNTQLNPLAISVNNGGGSNPVNITQPYLGLTAIICLAGVFPARN